MIISYAFIIYLYINTRIRIFKEKYIVNFNKKNESIKRLNRNKNRST